MDEAINIVDYSPAWPSLFQEKAEGLNGYLEPWLVGGVKHIGSTSVPGLAAKPLIDILAPVHSLQDAQSSISVLEEHGWLFWPDDPARYYRLWFLTPSPQARTHHLHVIEADDPHAKALITFRDRLRAESSLREKYAQLKMRLAAEHRENRNAYLNAKSDFVEKVLLETGLEPPARDPLPE